MAGSLLLIMPFRGPSYKLRLSRISAELILPYGLCGKNMFRLITNAAMDFQDAIFDYMANFLFNDMLPDTYDYTKLFGLWKGKGSKLDIKMSIFGTRDVSRYLHIYACFRTCTQNSLKISRFVYKSTLFF